MNKIVTLDENSEQPLQVRDAHVISAPEDGSYILCTRCSGVGFVDTPVGEVDQQMAKDAGDARLCGTMITQREICLQCGGNGWVCR